MATSPPPGPQGIAVLPRPQWLGRLPYRWAHRLQRTRRRAILDGRAPEAIWMLEHDPVITLGRRSVVPVPVGPPGTAVVATERGGLATWHGPGQLVIYLLIDLVARRRSIKGTVSDIEAGVIAWLGTQGVVAGRRRGFPGVWVGTDKICALGLHVRRGVTMHGLALNLTCDLAGYRSIVPCGITDGGVTSLAALIPLAPDPAAAADDVGGWIRRALVDTSAHGD